MSGLRVAVDDVWLMASRWGEQAADLRVGAPPGAGPAWQASAAAITSGHADISASGAALFARLQATAARVAAAAERYAANEGESAAILAALAGVAPGA